MHRAPQWLKPVVIPKVYRKAGIASHRKDMGLGTSVGCI